jgi:serine protease
VICPRFHGGAVAAAALHHYRNHMPAPAGLTRTRPRPLAAPAHRPALLAAVGAWLALGALPLAAQASAWTGGSPAPPSRIVVGYASLSRAGRARAATADASETTHTKVVALAPGEDVTTALKRLRAQPGVTYAVPDYRARAADAVVPDDEGIAHTPGGWQALQWNFDGEYGVGAPEAWAHVAAAGAAGGSGVIVAVLDTGVAYADRGRFRRSPDLSRFSFVKGYDFVGHSPYANDHNGHGTFVASTIAEQTDNRIGLTGLAWGAKIMPVRVLDSEGEGEASTIAEGVYFAVRHGARVINLSLEFSPGVTAADIPELIGALRYAHRRNVLVVAAAGNEGHAAIAYPARAPDVVSVGATTEHGCLALYSNDGANLTIVAPGGGPDANLPGDPRCHPEAPGRDIFQVTFTGASPLRFGIPSGYEGTSMATPHVSATAALVIASGVLGRHPSPSAIVARLRATARKLGGGGDERLYGAGLLDAAAATAPVAAVQASATGG